MTILGYIAWNPCNDDSKILYLLDIIRQKHNLKLSKMGHPNNTKSTSIAVEISGFSLFIKGEKKSIEKVDECISDMKKLLGFGLMTYTSDVLNFY